MRTTHAIAFLLGVCAALLAVLVFRPVQVIEAQSVMSNGPFVAVSSAGQPGGRDLLWLVDTRGEDTKLCVYELAEQDHLYLRSARNIRYDFMFEQFPAASHKHTPPVKDVFEQMREKLKQQKPPPK